MELFTAVAASTIGGTLLQLTASLPPRHNRSSNTVCSKPMTRRPSIVTPLVDVMCSGGFSILVILYVVAYTLTFPNGLPEGFHVEFNLHFFTLLMVSELLINFPHFAASYRILYRRSDIVRQHKFVAIWLPAIIGMVVLIAAFNGVVLNHGSGELIDSRVLQSIVPIAPLLLAWHYTGQSWGMTASFAYIEKIHMVDSERFMIRLLFHALLVYHVLLYCSAHAVFNSIPWLSYETVDLFAGFCGHAVGYWRYVVAGCFITGLIGFSKLSSRTRRFIPLRVWIPWFATLCWYIMVDALHSIATTFTLLQMFHALQYLIFPMRVEANDYAGQTAAAPSSWKRARHMLIYYVALAVVSFIAFRFLNFSAAVLTDSPLIQRELLELAAVISAGINVHHYFTDGVVWKLRHQGVRQSLFAHLDGH